MIPLTVGGLFALAARRTPNRTAVREDRGTSTVELSYDALYARALDAASDFRLERGLEAGDRVLMVAPNGIDFLVAVLACALSGTIIVPVSTQLTSPELAWITGNCRPRLVLVGVEHCPTVAAAVDQAFPDSRPAVVEVEAVGASRTRERLAGPTWQPPRPDDVLYLGYTSGTTGRPKGVSVTHANRVMSILLQAPEFGMGRDDTHLVVSPLYHTAPLTFALLHLCLGGAVTVRSAFDAGVVAGDIRAGRFTNCFLAPAALQRVLERLPEDTGIPENLRSVVIGGSPCPVSVKNEALRRLPDRLWEFYGATEVGIVSTLRPAEQVLRPRSAGRLIAGAEVEIREPDTGEVLGHGEVGELWTHTLTRSEGYFGMPPHADRWSFLGDVGLLDAEGFLHLVDRSADIIVSGGVNVYSREVEAVLETYPGILDVAVFGVPDERWGEAVTAAVRTDGVPLDVAAVTEFCRRSLAPYKCPRSLVVLDELPRSATGKPDKRALRARYVPRADRLSASNSTSSEGGTA